VVEGAPTPKPGLFPAADIGRVTPGAMRALGMRLLQGRFFDAHDNETGQPVCIVDDSFTKQNFPNESPLGKRVSSSGMPVPGQPIPWKTIVGVVAHVKN
jgi:hypothetical protein